MSFYLLFRVFKETKNVLLFQNIKICANSTNVEMFPHPAAKLHRPFYPSNVLEWTHLSDSLFFADFSNFLWRPLLVLKLLVKCLTFSLFFRMLLTCCLLISNSDANLICQLSRFSPNRKKIACFTSRHNTDYFLLNGVIWVNLERIADPQLLPLHSRHYCS